MTTSADLRALTVAALMGTTDAGQKVYSPLDVPTWDGEYPVLFVTTESEDGESWGKSGYPSFTVKSVIRVTGRVTHGALPNDAGAVAAYVALERLRDQVKAAVINGPGFLGPLGPLQQFPSFHVSMEVGRGENAGEHLGQVAVDIAMEFVQGPGDFYMPPLTDLQGIDVTVEEPDGTTEPGLSITYL